MHLVRKNSCRSKTIAFVYKYKNKLIQNSTTIDSNTLAPFTVNNITLIPCYFLIANAIVKLLTMGLFFIY